MAIIGTEWIDFVVYTLGGIHIEQIVFDHWFWYKELLPSLQAFFGDHVLSSLDVPPEAVDSQTSVQKDVVDGKRQGAEPPDRELVTIAPVGKSHNAVDVEVGRSEVFLDHDQSRILDHDGSSA